MKLQDLFEARGYMNASELKGDQATIAGVAKLWADEGVKLYDVDYTKGEYHLMVPVSEIDKIKEYDRTKNPNRTPEEMEELKQKIKKEGFKIPVHIQVHRNGDAPVLSEGNHRLVIAKQLGIKEVPAMFVFYQSR